MTRIYLVVSDVIEQVDKQYNLFLVAAEILTILTSCDAEQADKVRCGRHTLNDNKLENAILQLFKVNSREQTT